jgi:hypothetical protein
MADRLTAITPATATIRHTSAIAPITITVLGKQSRNPGPLASTDLTDTAGGLGVIGKRSADPGRRSAPRRLRCRRNESARRSLRLKLRARCCRIVPTENGAVTSAVLVHLPGGTGPLRLALTGATRSGSAGVGSLARDPLARLRRVQVESTGRAINFGPAAITNRDHRSIGPTCGGLAPVGCLISSPIRRTAAQLALSC